MRDLKNQLEDYLDHVVGRLETEDIHEPRLGTPPVRDGQRRVHPQRFPAWIYGLAGAVATLLVVGVGAWLIRYADGQMPSIPLDQPVHLAQPTLDDFEFTEAPADTERMLGWAPFVRPPGILSNGTRLLTESFEGADWVSSEGVVWSPGRKGVHPFYGGMGEFLAITTVATPEPSPSIHALLRRSSDGLLWSEAEPQDEAPWRLETYRYFGLRVDEILSLSLSLPNAWSGGGPAGAILKLDDTYIAYYFTDGYWQETPPDADTSYVGAAVSSDGRTWRSAEVPDFLRDWFQDGSRAQWDRGLSDQTWSWTFAVSGDRVLALTGDSGGHMLWESTDGLRWEPISISFVEQPSFDVFGQAASFHETRLPDGRTAPSAFPYRVVALEQGWAILPLGGITSLPPEEELSAVGRGVLFSVDGHNWLPLQFDEGFAAAAGDKIFIRSLATVIVASFEGSTGQE